MDTMRLSGHHIEDLFKLKQQRGIGGLFSRLIELYVIARKYSWKHALHVYKTRLSIYEDTIIEPVLGLDDICQPHCPYSELCEKGDHVAASKEVDKWLTPYEKYMRKIMPPLEVDNEWLSLQDTIAFRLFDLTEGEKIRFGDLKRLRSKEEVIRWATSRKPAYFD